jgi:hypothetical protein
MGLFPRKDGRKEIPFKMKLLVSIDNLKKIQILHNFIFIVEKINKVVALFLFKINNTV